MTEEVARDMDAVGPRYIFGMIYGPEVAAPIRERCWKRDHAAR